MFVVTRYPSLTGDFAGLIVKKALNLFMLLASPFPVTNQALWIKCPTQLNVAGKVQIMIPNSCYRKSSPPALNCVKQSSQALCWQLSVPFFFSYPWNWQGTVWDSKSIVHIQLEKALACKQFLYHRCAVLTLQNCEYLCLLFAWNFQSCRISSKL